MFVNRSDLARAIAESRCRALICNDANQAVIARERRREGKSREREREREESERSWLQFPAHDEELRLVFR
jgi:hypothetical protein